MSWKDGLRRVDFAGKKLIGASFRGVPFFVESSERDGGRRTVKHEFPFRDKPFVEDLGKRATTFRLEGYVIGADYLDQKEALRAAIEDTDGPGELVHPYYGVLSAIGETMSIRESRAEGGFAQFGVEFSETPAQSPQPTSVVDSTDRVSMSADAAHVAASAELVDAYDAHGLPGFALASAETAITGAAAALKERLASVVTATQEAALLSSQLALITAEASSLVRTPAAILDGFLTALTSLVTTSLDAPGAVLTALVTSYGADLGPLTTATTTTRARERANQVALQNALRRTFAIEAARLAPGVAYASIDDATAARDSITAMLDEQAAAAGDTAYPALVDLRAQLLQAVPGGQEFARIISVTRAVPVPSLLLAYQLYGAVDLEDDVIARNGVAHPGFVAGDLKVLSDA